MKILFVTSTLLPVKQFIINFSKFDEVILIYISKNNEQFISTNILIYKINAHSRINNLSEINSYIDIFHLFPTFIKLFYYIIIISYKENVDIINAHWAIPSGFIVSISSKILKLMGKKVVVVTTVRGSDIKIFPNKKLYFSIIKYALLNSHGIIALSYDLKKSIFQMGLNKKIKVIPGGVDLTVFYPHNKNQLRIDKDIQVDDFIITFIGNLIKLKRVDKLLKTSKKIYNTHPHKLFIIGDGPEEKNLKKISKKLLMNNTTFFGRIPHNKVPEFLSISDLLILPSKSEGLPTIVQESMACGVPILATKVGGLSELVINGYNGYIVDNINQMEEKLKEILTKDDFERMSINCITYSQEFSLNQVIIKTRNFFQDLCSIQSLDICV